MKRILFLAGVIIPVCVAAYFWVNTDRPRKDNAPILDEESFQRTYVSGDLTGTANAIQASGTADPELLMLAASCYRRLGQVDEFVAAMNDAQEKMIEPAIIKLATDLFDVQLGNFDTPPERQVDEFEQRGVPSGDARSAVILGSVMRGDLASAVGLVDEWNRQQPASREIGYLRAILARSESRWGETETLLQESISTNQQHELSYLALAEFYSQPPNINLEKCLLVLEQCRLRFPGNRKARVRLARVYREQGKISFADEVLQAEVPTQAEIVEKAELALDAGKYARSIELTRQSGLSDTTEFIAMIDMAFQMNLRQPSNAADELSQRARRGAVALALGGRNDDAALVFDFVFDRVARLRRLSDLQTKNGLLPGNQAIVNEINTIVAPAFNQGHPTLAGRTLGDDGINSDPGDQLYLDHCATCHGPTGDGWGRASRHLFPAPRNFRDEPLRLVSTQNRLASDQDLAQTIRTGLGGASMPAFPQFSDEQIQQIIAVVRRCQIEGLRDQYNRKRAESAITNDTSDENENGEKEAEQWVSRRSEPGAALVIPSFDGLGESAAASGEESFMRAGCMQCHAVSSEQGEDLPRLFDHLGRPIAARDLVNARFRSGNSRKELYKRVVLGMPGSPHPAIGDIPEKEILDIVQYIHGLSRKTHDSPQPSSPRTTNDQRRRQSAL